MHWEYAVFIGNSVLWYFFQSVLQELETKRPLVEDIQNRADRLKSETDNAADKQTLQDKGKMLFFIYICVCHFIAEYSSSIYTVLWQWEKTSFAPGYVFFS